MVFLPPLIFYVIWLARLQIHTDSPLVILPVAFPCSYYTFFSSLFDTIRSNILFFTPPPSPPCRLKQIWVSRHKTSLCSQNIPATLRPHALCTKTGAAWEKNRGLSSCHHADDVWHPARAIINHLEIKKNMPAIIWVRAGKRKIYIYMHTNYAFLQTSSRLWGVYELFTGSSNGINSL